MFGNQQKVMISATDELPTKFDGQHGWIQRQLVAHPEFWEVITKDGNLCIFHESQLRAEHEMA